MKTEMSPTELGREVRLRLMELANMQREEDPEAEAASSESEADLVAVLASLQPAETPSITLDAAGLFWARWRKAANSSATLRFLGGGRVAYVLATADKGNPERPRLTDGRIALANVGDVIRGQPDLGWIFRR